MLSAEERELLRAQLDGVCVEDWAAQNGTARSTDYRLLSRIKSLCRIKFDQRSKITRLNVLDVLRAKLQSRAAEVAKSLHRCPGFFFVVGHEAAHFSLEFGRGERAASVGRTLDV